MADLRGGRTSRPARVASSFLPVLICARYLDPEHRSGQRGEYLALDNTYVSYTNAEYVNPVETNPRIVQTDSTLTERGT